MLIGVLNPVEAIACNVLKLILTYTCILLNCSYVAFGKYCYVYWFVSCVCLPVVSFQVKRV
jgi:hypothetical protein